MWLVFHGATYLCLGFRFCDIVYLSDVVDIPEDVMDKIEGAKIIILDALNREDFTHLLLVPLNIF